MLLIGVRRELPGVSFWDRNLERTPKATLLAKLVLILIFLPKTFQKTTA
jgi:hypothetical protein